MARKTGKAGLVARPVPGEVVGDMPMPMQPAPGRAPQQRARGPVPPGTSKPAQEAPGKRQNFRAKTPPKSSPPVRKADKGASPNDRIAAQLTTRLRARDTRLG
jgi:hypothetical protein